MSASSFRDQFDNCTDLVRCIVAWMMLALLAVGLLQAFLQYDSRVEHNTQRALARAQSLGAALPQILGDAGTEHFKRAQIQAAIERLVAIDDSSEVTVFAADGNVVTASSFRGQRRRTTVQSAELMTAMKRVSRDGRGLIINAKHAGDERTFVLVPLTVRGKSPAEHPSGVVAVAVNLSEIRAEARHVALESVLIVVGQILAVWFVVATLLRRWVLVPLQRLAQATVASLESGRFVVPAQLPANEIGQLARAFERVFGTLTESQRQAKKLALVAARTDNAVIITDAEGKIEWVNESFERMTDYTLAEVLGQDCSFLQGAETDLATVEQIRQSVARGEGFSLEVCCCAKHGRRFWVAVEAQPNCDADDKQTRFIALVRDITERRQAEEDLKSYSYALETTNTCLQQFINAAETATRAKSEFLANMSHEIRTPMTAILGYSEVLLEEPGAEPGTPRGDALLTIRRNGEYLIELINDILDLSKIEAGHLEVERIRCAPLELAQDVIKLMQVRADAKGLSLSLAFEGTLPASIESDPTRVRQILINLVANAIKFTEHGTVCLTARCIPDESGLGHQLQFDVRDSGIGMTSVQLSRLFRPFSQADSSTTRKFGGTGLGLSISKRLAEMLGGDISVESTYGEGSRFRLQLALHDSSKVTWVNPLEAREETTRGAAPAVQPAVQIEARILLAEDGLGNQRLITHVLRKAGATVEVAENGLVACEKALAARDAGVPFDVILMDMQMPVLDGYDATRKLRDSGYLGPIVALTAHAMSSARDTCISAGCDDYCAKPIDRPQLLRTIAACLSPVEFERRRSPRQSELRATVC
ncbi:MAG: response regulator [Pirellulales bacterium]|nr:response regulator [Pirellulales bacterium]